MKNTLKKNWMVWVVVAVFFMFLPIPLMPCFETVVMMPPQPQKLILCRGYFVEKMRYGESEGANLNWDIFLLTTIAMILGTGLMVVFVKKGKRK